jgi:putative tryptophan/tyrosine transport system substrate-binding protein
VKRNSRLHRPIGLLCLAAAATLLTFRDTTSSPPRTIAFIGTAAEPEDAGFARFRAAVARAWPAGTTPTLLVHYHGDKGERLRQAVRDAVATRPAVLVLPTALAASAAASTSVPPQRVFASYPDPVRFGIVESMRRPGTGVTGISLLDTLHLKRLEVLKDAFPSVRTVAVLADRDWMADIDMPRLSTQALQHLDLQLLARECDTLEELEALLDSAQAGQAEAWYVPPSYIAYLAEAQIITGLKRLKRPAIHATDDEVAAGGLMAYSPDTRFAYDAMAQLAVRVALGEDAGAIPIQRPYRHTLTVRIEPDAPWAQIDPRVIRRADRVIRP